MGNTAFRGAWHECGSGFGGFPLLPPSTEDFDGGGVERDEPFTGAALGRAFFGFPAALDDLSGDGEQAVVEVDIVPVKSGSLAAAQPPEGDQVVERVEPVAGGGVEEPAGLLGRPHHDSRAWCRITYTSPE